MLKTGLVSATFRAFAPEKIVAVAKKANLNGIEWGGDVHVPPNDFERAAKVSELTDRANLKVAAYGSYFRLGTNGDFESVLRAAEILRTKTIRVWAGEIGSKEADENYRNKIIEESKRIADSAAEKDVSIVYEFHGGTLADSAESCFDLLKKANRPNLKTYWQTPVGKSVEANLRDIETLLPFVAGVHVFHWLPGDQERHSLENGAEDWARYFRLLKKIDGFALIEFVKDDALENFERDARTLKTLLAVTER